MNRTFYISLTILLVTSLLVGAACFYKKGPLSTGQAREYALAPLPYAFNALEPYIDEETMRIHYEKHHEAYVRKLNAALLDYPEVAKKPIEYLLTHVSEVPEAIRTAVKNNGGGYINHTFFWTVMTPDSTKEPVGETKKLIEKTFGSFEAFKKEFDKAALSVFGSGWAWLVLDSKGGLQVMTTANQDIPQTSGLIPLLTLDVWEHAYYLKYQNRRNNYTDAWWHVVNWKQVEKNYQKARGANHGN